MTCNMLRNETKNIEYKFFFLTEAGHIQLYIIHYKSSTVTSTPKAGVILFLVQCKVHAYTVLYDSKNTSDAE